MSESTSQKHAALLNANQRRRVEIVLSHLERALVDIERLASPPSAGAPLLSSLTYDLPGDFASKAAPVIAAMRLEIARLAEEYALVSRSMSRVRTIAALVHSESMRLEDSEPRRLKGYGIVHPELEAALTPELRRLQGMLAELGRAVEGRSAPGEGGGV